MKAKIVSVFIFVNFLWVLILGRAAYLQFLPHDKLNGLHNRQFQADITLPARRGAILDTFGKELAMSAPSYSLYADPKVIKRKKETAEALSKILSQSNKEIFSKIKDSKKRFVWIDRIIDASTADTIRQMNIRGLGLVEDWKRVYPNDSLLGAALGFIGKEGQALEGLELYYDKDLRGEDKKVTIERDARGRPLLQDGLLFTEPPQGKELRLTIDSELQYFVESELAQTIEHHKADGGWVVVLDAQTSAIRAMANLPTYNPNQPQSYSSFTKRNRAVTDTFEPGSTLKTFVIASAIDNKIVNPSTKIFCENGQFKIGKRIIREAEKSHSQGNISVSEVLAVSSNIGTSKIALMMGDDQVKQSLGSFGFGERSGIDLPGEAKGITIRLPWNDHLLANVSFGQGITTTPLQLANAYAVIANGGVLNRPYIVESLSDTIKGSAIKNEKKEIRRVISEETASKMRLMLTAVTSDGGTGMAARVPGYIVGGKTGTAQKIRPVGKGYLSGGYIGSFAGFIPANAPKFVIFVGVDYPKANGYYGSIVAAPLFSKIASYAVRKIGVNPEILTEENLSRSLPLKKETENAERSADKVLVLNREDETENVKEDLVVDTNPKSTPNSTQAVPYLKSLTMREVLNIASEQKIQVKLVGTGRVESTIPAQGEALNENREITVILK